MQAQILMLVPVILSSTTLHNAESVLKRYSASRTETVAVLDAAQAKTGPSIRPQLSSNSGYEATIASDACTRKASEPTQALPGSSPADAPAADLPGTKDSVSSEPTTSKKDVMPTPGQLAKTRAGGCVKKSLWLTESANGLAETTPDTQHRPTASVYGGPSLAATPAKTKSSLKKVIIENAKPDIFNEGALRKNGSERRIHRLPGELPAGAPIPDAPL